MTKKEIMKVLDESKEKFNLIQEGIKDNCNYESTKDLIVWIKLKDKVCSLLCNRISFYSYMHTGLIINYHRKNIKQDFGKYFDIKDIQLIEIRECGYQFNDLPVHIMNLLYYADKECTINVADAFGIIYIQFSYLLYDHGYMTTCYNYAVIDNHNITLGFENMPIYKVSLNDFAIYNNLAKLDLIYPNEERDERND